MSKEAKAKRGRPPKTAVAVVEKKDHIDTFIETHPLLPEDMKKKAIEKPTPVKQLTEQTMAALVLKGDLSGLNPAQKMEYYYRLCEHLHLDPVTRPFDIINIRGREIMYAHKGCTDQLRKQNGVSVTDIKGEQVSDVYRVTAIGHDKTGRTDAATGVVSIGRLSGDELANALMKAETKAKRRLTLSLCGLGMLDETEIETIPGATTVALAEMGKLDAQKQDAPIPTTAEPAIGLAPNQETVETEVGDVPKPYWNKRSKQVLFDVFGPAIDYRVYKNDEGVWRVVKIEEKVAVGAGVSNGEIPF